MSTSVYWIRHKDHTDIFSQGYVGVSSNCNRRWEDHKKGNTNSRHLKNAIKKYGWDNLIKEIVLIAEDSYCYYMELKLRSKDKTGWNLCIGGGKPPNQLGKKRSVITILKKSGKNNHYFKNGELLQGALNPNFKGTIEAINLTTYEKKILIGAKDIKAAGFTTTHVYSCINGKAKFHKGYTFKRLEV